jgi:hypothetical protein
MNAITATTAAPAAQDVPSTLGNKIAVMEAAWDAFEAVNGAHDGEGPEVEAAEAHALAVGTVRQHQPATLAEFALKLRALNKPSGNSECEAATNLEILAVDAYRLGQTGRTGPPLAAPVTPDATTFSALRAAYEALYAAHKDYRGSAWCRGWDAMLEEMPAVLKHQHIHGRWARRWYNAEALRKDPLLDRATINALTPMVAAWDARFKALDEIGKAEFDRALDDKQEQDYDRVTDLEAMVMAAPAPDMAAFAYKVLLAARENDDDKIGYDDLGLVAFKEHSYLPDQYEISHARDVLRLAGIDHPMLNMGVFDPREWIKDYENTGGLVSYGTYCLIITPPQRESASAAATLRQKADRLGWAYRAIFLAAEKRAGQGGDPIFDAHGGWGATDNRGGRKHGNTQFYGPVERAERIYFRPAATGLEAVVEPVIFGVPAEHYRALFPARTVTQAAE